MQAKSSASVRRVQSTFGFRPRVRAAISSARQAASGARRCAREIYGCIVPRNIAIRYRSRTGVRQECAGLRETAKPFKTRQAELELAPRSADNHAKNGASSANSMGVGEEEFRITAVLPYFLNTAQSPDSFPRESDSPFSQAAILGSQLYRSPNS
jgi:hypothetical protein